MNRKILLIEPNYRNKYPPMGLMKLATYYRKRGDDVRFFKGDLKVLAAQLLCEEFLTEVNDPKLGKQVPKLIEHIKTGKFAPLDTIPNFRYSDQITYQYPACNAYMAYMTHGCPRKCAFCAVPRLEPEYMDYVGIKEQIRQSTKQFGPQKDLLLMDNNVFASKHFHKIIDEIKECGFERGAMYIPESEYDIAIKNLRDGYNVRAYKKKLIRLYDLIPTSSPRRNKRTST